MYAIVIFLDESDAPGIVCTHWINSEENLCQYPNVRSNEARDKLLRKLAQPAQDWIPCRIKILHKYSTFSEAVRHLSKAEDTSNLESDEEILSRPRKKLKRHIVTYPEVSDEDCPGPALAQKSAHTLRKTYNIEPYPIPPTNSPSELQPQTLGLSIPPTNIQICTNSVSDVHSSKSLTVSSQYKSPQSSSSALEKSPGYSSNQNVMNNGKLMSWMADISEKVLMLDEKIDQVLKNQTKLLERNHEVPEKSFDSDEYTEILGSLPVIDDSSFVGINKKIAEESRLRHLLVKVLISVGGKDMRCHIHNMLRRLLSDDVAELYTLHGKSTIKNTTKKPFLSTEVSKSIFSACQRVFKDEATDVKIKEAVGDWLNQAKVRKIRRMQRHEKNMEMNNE